MHFLKQFLSGARSSTVPSPAVIPTRYPTHGIPLFIHLPVQSAPRNTTRLNSASTPGPMLSSYADPPTSRILNTHPPPTQNSSFELPNLSLPLRPIWMTPATTTFPSIPDMRTFLPVICLSASKQVQAGTERRSVGFSYVQGSGDDHELWSMVSICSSSSHLCLDLYLLEGLTPDLFWTHRPALLSASRSELPALIQKLVDADTKVTDIGGRTPPSPPSPVAKVGGRLLICTLCDLSHLNLEEEVAKDDETAYVLINHGDPRTDASEAAPSQGPNNSPHIHQLDGEITTPSSRSPKIILYLTHNFPSSKKGHFHFLSHILPASYAFIDAHLTRSENTRVCVACETGKDVSIGIVLAVLGGMFNDEGVFVGTSTSSGFRSLISLEMAGLEDSGQRLCDEEMQLSVQREHVDKKSLRTRLEWIIASRPVANPARATLKRVNEFLITPGRVGSGS